MEQVESINVHSVSLSFRLHLSLNVSVNSRMAIPGADPGFDQGGPQLLSPKVANVAKRLMCSWGPGPA